MATQGEQSGNILERVQNIHRPCTNYDTFLLLQNKRTYYIKFIKSVTFSCGPMQYRTVKDHR